MNEERKSALAKAGEVEIIPAQESNAPHDELVAHIEARSKLMDRLLVIAVSATHPSMWNVLGDEPRPSAPACECMARQVGISWKGMQGKRREWRSEDGRTVYEWAYSATFYVGKESIEVEGFCNSDDQFLGTNFGDGPRSLDEVDEGSIRQASISNMVYHGITRLLGVRKLTQERLDAIFAGRGGTAAMGKVDYRSGARGGGRSNEAGRAEDIEIRWGNCKGKKLSELSDKDVRYYLGAWEKNLADPDKAKYRKQTEKEIAAAKALLAARAGAAAGQTATPYQKIMACAERLHLDVDSAHAETKKITGKEKSSELTEEDAAKVIAAFEQWDRDLTGGGGQS